MFWRKPSIKETRTTIENLSKKLAQEIMKGSPNLVVDYREITVGMLVTWLEHYVEGREE